MENKTFRPNTNHPKETLLPRRRGQIKLRILSEFIKSTVLVALMAGGLCSRREGEYGEFLSSTSTTLDDTASGYNSDESDFVHPIPTS